MKFFNRLFGIYRSKSVFFCDASRLVDSCGTGRCIICMVLQGVVYFLKPALTTSDSLFHIYVCAKTGGTQPKLCVARIVVRFCMANIHFIILLTRIGMMRLDVQLHVTELDPADLAQNFAEQQRQKRRQDEADDGDADPHHHPAVGHGGHDAERADQSAGAHAGGNAGAFQLEHRCGQRAGDHGCQRCGDPDARIFHDVAHLQHGSAESLRDDAAESVFTEADDRKADHLRTAACRCRTARKTRDADHGTDGGGADRQRQRDADGGGHQNAHDDRLHDGGGVDEPADPIHTPRDERAGQPRSKHARHYGDDRGDQDVNLRFL